MIEVMLHDIFPPPEKQVNIKIVQNICRRISKFIRTWAFILPASIVARVGRPPGMSVRSLSYCRIFSASARILLTFTSLSSTRINTLIMIPTLLPYARSAWYPTMNVRGSSGAMAAGVLVLIITQYNDVTTQVSMNEIYSREWQQANSFSIYMNKARCPPSPVLWYFFWVFTIC